MKLNRVPQTLALMSIALGLVLGALTQAQSTGPLSGMKYKIIEGWDQGSLNSHGDNWTFEKGVDLPQGRILNRFYIDVLPSTDPTTAAEYAASLKQENSQYYGAVYSEITETSEIPGGFMIKGRVKDLSEPAADPTFGVTIVREIGGVKIRCASAVLSTEALRDEAIAICQSAAL